MNLFIKKQKKLFIQRKYSFKWKMDYRPGLGLGEELCTTLVYQGAVQSGTNCQVCLDTWIYSVCTFFSFFSYCGLDESKGVLWLKCTKLRWIQMIRGVGAFWTYFRWLVKCSIVVEMYYIEVGSNDDQGCWVQQSHLGPIRSAAHWKRSQQQFVSLILWTHTTNVLWCLNTSKHTLIYIYIYIYDWYNSIILPTTMSISPICVLLFALNLYL